MSQSIERNLELTGSRSRSASGQARRALVADGTKARTTEEEGEASPDASFIKHINYFGAE